MILAVGIGNTNIRAAVGEPFTRGAAEFSLRADAVADAADFTRFLTDSFGAARLKTLAGGMVCSVVPGKTGAVSDAVLSATGKTPRRAGRVPLASRYDGVLGEDRAVCCAAALRLFGPPLAVVDMGTATTVNFVGPDGVFRGGAILAGVQTGLDALTGQTSLLPPVDADSCTDAPLIGRDTRGCLLSGALMGTAFAVGGYVRRFHEILGPGKPPKVIVTGGHAPAVLPYCEFECEYIPGLLIDGLFMLYKESE